jgi:uncharacterized membrane protein
MADAGDASNEVAPACPSQLPSDSDCATTAPDYASVIAPVLAARCGFCHSPTGIESVTLFDTFPRIKAGNMQVHVFTQIYDCLMPPANVQQLLPAEREALLQWFVCDAPFGGDGSTGSDAGDESRLGADAAQNAADAE